MRRGQQPSGSMILLAVLAVLYLMAWGGTRAVKAVLFDINCGGHITRASHANTVDLARQELVGVVKYLEENRLTDGYTSILYQTPDEDVGFWYKNLKDSLEELHHVKSDASQLEKSNVLIKLRESLQSHGEKGDSIIVPGGISVYPNNTAYAVWASISGLLFLIAGFKSGIIEP